VVLLGMFISFAVGRVVAAAGRTPSAAAPPRLALGLFDATHLAIVV
jgi:hypothetical protein